MNRERLRKLVAHLRSDPPGFNMNEFPTCLAGQCPDVFPEDWERDPEDGWPILKGSPAVQRPSEMFAGYFGVPSQWVKPCRWGNEPTAAQVADQIEAEVERA